jgi:hypothetical protein
MDNSGGQDANLQFGHLFNQELTIIDVKHKATMAYVEVAA